MENIHTTYYQVTMLALLMELILKTNKEIEKLSHFKLINVDFLIVVFKTTGMNKDFFNCLKNYNYFNMIILL